MSSEKRGLRLPSGLPGLGGSAVRKGASALRGVSNLRGISKLSQLSIGRRLGLGFLAVVVVMLGVAGVGVVRVQQLADKLSTINDVNAVKVQYALVFKSSVQNRSIGLRDVVLAQSTIHAEPFVEQIEASDLNYAKTAKKMSDLFDKPGMANDRERAALDQIASVERTTIQSINDVIKMRRSSQPERAYDMLINEARPQFVSWLAAIDSFVDLENELNDQASADARAIANGFLTTMLLMGGLAAAIAFTISWLITRSITRPLADAVTVLGAVEEGDLTQRIQVRSADEVGRMAVSVNTALTSIGSVMSGFARSISGLNSASERLTAVSEQIATGAERSSAEADRVAAAAGDVSANVQSVAAGSEEMGASIREIAHNAQEATLVGARAREVVDNTTTTIAELGESSRMIGDVVKVISSIAKQTNLLALNATIEAARAGDAGKGFAVVATEVKDLAQETAKATEDISQRVDAIQAGTAGAVSAIADVADVISRMNDYQMTIASAVEEQTATTAEMNRSVVDGATGSEQIARSIDGVAAIAKATTESVGESRQAVDELSEISAELRSLVTQFRF
ncbi:methyl-accepting chemotaxis protein [Luedemannella flava]|uniref:Methyl-accepting chemotaxis protein n=1 Tax=Luedemannella flava TaxID=349316 RepID=A0ABN2LJE3_9ACTN